MTNDQEILQAARAIREAHAAYLAAEKAVDEARAALIAAEKKSGDAGLALRQARERLNNTITSSAARGREFI